MQQAIFKLTSAIAALVLAGPLLAQQVSGTDSQTGAGSPGETFGDWQTVCEGSGCRLSQSIVASETGASLLLVRIYPGETPTAVMTAPLGVFLKTGLVIKVDGNRPRAFGFEICDDLGCHAGIALDPDLIREFRRGLTAEVTFFDGAQTKVSLPVSLTGFTAGLQAVESAE